MRRFLLLCALVMWATTTLAEAPSTSARPVPNPNNTDRRAAIDLAVDRAMSQVVQPGVTGATAPEVSSRPIVRPENLRRRGTVAASGMAAAPVRAPQAGPPICGFRDVAGERRPKIPGRIRGCGVEAPVRITAIGGIALSQPATMDCRTVAALRSWMDQGMKPAIGRLGGGVARVDVAAHYACRTRNNLPGARISEHGRGRAIDISGFTLQNGTRITVLRGWRDRDHGRRLRQMHRAACGPFGTVLGPDSDRFHADHFHFDTARYRSGPYCR